MEIKNVWNRWNVCKEDDNVVIVGHYGNRNQYKDIHFQRDLFWKKVCKLWKVQDLRSKYYAEWQPGKLRISIWSYNESVLSLNIHFYEFSTKMKFETL